MLGKAYDDRLVRRLLQYMEPYQMRLIIAVVLMVDHLIAERGRARGSSAAPSTPASARATCAPSASGRSLFSSRPRSNGSSTAIASRIMAYVGTKVVADMRSNLFRHLHKLSLSFHINYSVGRLMSRLISDVGVLQDFVTWSITGLARSLFILIGIVIAMLLMNWQLALITFSVLPFMFLLTNYWRKHVRFAYRATRQRLSLINGYLNESISGIRVTKSFTREQVNARPFR